jgi:hypothetical protein
VQPTAEEILSAVVEDYLERVDSLSFPEMAAGQQGFHSSLAFGAAGIAYACWYAARVLDDPGLLEPAERWSREALVHQRHRLAFRVPKSELAHRPPSQFLYGLAGVFFVRALVAHSRGDVRVRDRSLRRFEELSRQSLAGKPELYNGSSGCLAATAILASQIGGRRLEELGRDLSRALSGRAVQAGEGKDGLLLWPELQGIGLAHGSAGPHLALLLWASVSGSPLPEGLAPSLLALLAAADREPERVSRDERYHGLLCNGFTGLAYLGAKAARVLGDPRFVDAARSALGRVLGAIPEQPGLCCGRAGVASACLALARVDPDGPWRERARHLTLSTLLCEPGDWFSAGLYDGEAAIPCLALQLTAGIDAGPPALEIPEGIPFL